MSAYYNEHDDYAAEWLRNLIAAGHIADGIVDQRSIAEVAASDLHGFTQCHFFAGIGVWSHALRRAGWSDDRPVWTGSCPCQPFSAAGQRKGIDDARHLWPTWFRLIEECRPPVVLGEQVASKDGLGWLDLVSTDLEGAGYAFGASDLCAAGFGGAHIRQRLYFCGLADTLHAGRAERGAITGSGSATGSGASGGLADTTFEQHHRSGRAGPSGRVEHPNGSGVGGLADPDGRHTGAERKQPGGEYRQQPQDSGLPDGLADAALGGQPGQGGRGGAQEQRTSELRGTDLAGPTGAPLLGRNPADWLFCRDGKWRPVEPGTSPLADAAPQRVGRLRAYGNALDAETATQFIAAVMECL